MKFGFFAVINCGKITCSVYVSRNKSKEMSQLMVDIYSFSKRRMMLLECALKATSVVNRRIDRYSKSKLLVGFEHPAVHLRCNGSNTLTEYLLSMLVLSTFFVEAAFALPAVAEAAMTVVVV